MPQKNLDKCDEGHKCYKYGFVEEEYRDATINEMVFGLGCKGIVVCQLNSLKIFDLPLSQLDISVRLDNVLKNNNIKMVSELLDMKYVKFVVLKSIGTKTIEEAINVLRKTCQLIDAADVEQLKEWTRLSKNLTSFFGYELSNVIDNEIITAKVGCNNSETDLLDKIMSNPIFSQALSSKLLAKIDVTNAPIAIDEILKDVPNVLHIYAEDAIKGIVSGNKISCKKKYYSICDEELSEYIKKLPQNRRLEILKMRLRGDTYEKIGGVYQLTRERIRQILVKEFYKMPVLKEDSFSYIFTTYAFTLDSFRSITNEPDKTYHYLNHKYQVGNKDLSLMMTDENVDSRYKKRADKYLFANWVTIDGYKIPPTRYDIVIYLLKKWGHQSISTSAFEKICEDEIRKAGLDKQNKYQIRNEYFYTNFQDARYVLRSGSYNIRYYDTANPIVKQFFKELPLQKYYGCEISAEKIFHDNLDLMKTFDIRNGNELHNLIKKSPTKWLPVKVTAKRMPYLEIGKVNLKKQMIRLLQEIAPVKKGRFAQEFELRYGHNAKTLATGGFHLIDEYYYNGKLQKIPYNEMYSPTRKTS